MTTGWPVPPLCRGLGYRVVPALLPGEVVDGVPPLG
jgi:hypothetical protein